jgi:hypothetical protein
MGTKFTFLHIIKKSLPLILLIELYSCSRDVISMPSLESSTREFHPNISNSTVTSSASNEAESNSASSLHEESSTDVLENYANLYTIPEEILAKQEEMKLLYEKKESLRDELREKGYLLMAYSQ